MNDSGSRRNSDLQAGISNAQPATTNVHLSFRNYNGSVQHYYHFLFAVVIPLIRNWNVIATNAEAGDIFVRSCAIMDGLLRQLQLPRLVILDVADHAAMCDRHNSSVDRKGLLFLTLDGYDDPVRYDAEAFRSVRDLLFFRFSEEIRREMRKVGESFGGNGQRVVFIRRLPADKFYSQAECEIKSAGAERRSIANIEELASAAQQYSDNVLVAALEGRSFFYQLALFAVADIIICQHGAALGNLVWTKNSASVIEVIPKERKDGIRECDYFGDLARCLSLKHYRLWQDLPHGPVDTEALSNILHSITSSRDGRQSSEKIGSSGLVNSRLSRLKMARRSYWLMLQKLRNVALRAVNRRAS